jgi:hypothetical protein
MWAPRLQENREIWKKRNFNEDLQKKNPANEENQRLERQRLLLSTV